MCTVSFVSRASRRNCIAKVGVTWLAGGRRHRESAEIQDKSESGLGVTMPIPIGVETILALQQGFSTSFGVVRHCTKLQGKFFIGIELCDVETPQTTPEEPTAMVKSGEQTEVKAVPVKPSSLPDLRPAVSRPSPTQPVTVRNSRRTDLVMVEPPTRVPEPSSKR